MGDWRDPLDPDLDAQILFSQFLKGRQSLIKKYLPGQPPGLTGVSSMQGFVCPLQTAATEVCVLRHELQTQTQFHVVYDVTCCCMGKISLFRKLFMQ